MESTPRRDQPSSHFSANLLERASIQTAVNRYSMIRRGHDERLIDKIVRS